jgi:hypothetical protein
MLTLTDYFLRQPQVAQPGTGIAEIVVKDDLIQETQFALEIENTEKGQARVPFKIIPNQYFVDPNIIHTCHMIMAFSCKNQLHQVSLLREQNKLNYVWANNFPVRAEARSRYNSWNCMYICRVRPFT